MFPKYQESFISGLSHPLYKKMGKFFFCFFLHNLIQLQIGMCLVKNIIFSKFLIYSQSYDKNMVDVLVSLNIIEVIMMHFTNLNLILK